jgi:hypothetical protein
MNEKWASPAVRQLNDLAIEERSWFGNLIEIVTSGWEVASNNSASGEV